MVVITDEQVSRLLALNEGERIHAFWPEPATMGIAVGIKGDALPEVAAFAPAPRVHRDLVTERLRQEFIELRSKWRRGEFDGPDGDWNDQGYIDALHEVLDKALGLSL